MHKKNEGIISLRLLLISSKIIMQYASSFAVLYVLVEYVLFHAACKVTPKERSLKKSEPI